MVDLPDDNGKDFQHPIRIIQRNQLRMTFTKSVFTFYAHWQKKLQELNRCAFLFIEIFYYYEYTRNLKRRWEQGIFVKTMHEGITFHEEM